jgi:hypothetical protein
MPWFKVDDDFFSNAKIMLAGNAAVGLYVRCGAWSSKHLTEGFLPTKVAKDFGSLSEIRALVRERLWVVKEDGYLMRDFLEYNPTKEQVQAGRDKNAARQRKSRAA